MARDITKETMNEEERLEHEGGMRALVEEMTQTVKDRIERRRPIEERWIKDLRQFHGHYEPDVVEKLNKLERSQVFINMTRPRTTALSARLSDLLFPTDERNWGIGPTPVPEMAGGAEEVQSIADSAKELRDQAAAKVEPKMEAGDLDGAGLDLAEAEEADSLAQAAENEAAELHEVLGVAGRAAVLMQDEIDDQLKGCQYSAQARLVIDDATKVGIGVMKGPVANLKPRKKWVEDMIEGEDGVAKPTGEYSLNLAEQSAAPCAYRVSYWHFFPDPDCKDPADGDGVFERHMMNAKQMRAMATEQGIKEEAIRSILSTKPSEDEPTFMVDLHELGEETQSRGRVFYHVWEYTGPMDHEKLEMLSKDFGDQLDEYRGEDGEFDPLLEMNVRLWFCQGHLLRFGVHHLDSGETVYSTFPLEPDEESPWAFGVPYLMRHPQAILNGANRMMMDNAGVSTGPQIVIDSESVTPADGSWRLEAFKIWEKEKHEGGNQRPFEVFNIDMNQAELANIIAMATDTIDDVTSMPPIAMGEGGANVNETAQGRALMMNSANVVFRRWVKHFDDGITTPMVRRFYDWNMQFSSKRGLKGDFEVDARGSSVLLVREMQSRNLMMIASTFGDHPRYGDMIDDMGLMRHIFQAHMIPTDDVLLPEREYKKLMAKKKEAPNPEQMLIEAKAQEAELDRALRREEMESKAEIARMETESRTRVAELNFEASMHELAEKLNMSREELDAKLKIADMGKGEKTEAAKIAAAQKDRSLATEVAMATKTGESAGGAV